MTTKAPDPRPSFSPRRSLARGARPCRGRRSEMERSSIPGAWERMRRCGEEGHGAGNEGKRDILDTNWFVRLPWGHEQGRHMHCARGWLHAILLCALILATWSGEEASGTALCAPTSASLCTHSLQRSSRALTEPHGLPAGAQAAVGGGRRRRRPQSAPDSPAGPAMDAPTRLRGETESGRSAAALNPKP